jgi:peptidoglycan/LPS O-acetylase OafA/YrhL
VNAALVVFYRPLASKLGLAIAVFTAALALLTVGLLHGSIAAAAFLSNFALGPFRVAFSFFAGVLLQRLDLTHGRRLSNIWVLILAMGLAALLDFDPGPYKILYQLGCALLLIPAIVFTASAIECTGMVERLCGVAGEASYAICILHLPAFSLLLAVQKHRVPGF